MKNYEEKEKKLDDILKKLNLMTSKVVKMNQLNIASRYLMMMVIFLMTGKNRHLMTVIGT